MLRLVRYRSENHRLMAAIAVLVRVTQPFSGNLLSRQEVINAGQALKRSWTGFVERDFLAFALVIGYPA
jgi:hypothetical protein